MAEVNADAMTLITISWRALNRAKHHYNQGELGGILCDSTIMILFASIFIEANLNYIIDALGFNDRIRVTLGPNAGLQLKLSWIYNEFIAGKKVMTWNKSSKKDTEIKLYEEFPGYREIHSFRNEISHGYIDPSVANLEKAEIIRQQAKSIVDQIFTAIKKNGFEIPRITTYNDVIELQKRNTELIKANPIVIPITKSS